MISEVRELLAAKVGDIPGAKVEDNKFCLSVHFRCVDDEVRTCSLSYWVSQLNSAQQLDGGADQLPFPVRNGAGWPILSGPCSRTTRSFGYPRGARCWRSAP
jgi:hypothetical protein